MRDKTKENEIGVPSQEYVEEIIRSKTKDSQHPPEIEDLLSEDYPLSNTTSADRKYFRLKAANIVMYAHERYPPKESILQGVLGAALLDDPSYNKRSLTEIEKNRNRTALMEHFSRSSRGVGGWQQDKFSENIRTNRVEDNREQSDDSSGGGLSKIFKR